MEISLMEHTDSPAVHFKLAQIKTTNSWEDGICNHMNVSGKWQARYQMLTIWVAVVKCSSRTGAVLLDQLDRSDPTQTQTAVFSQKSPLCNTQFYTLILFFFFFPTISGLQQQHITAITGVTKLLVYACKFRISKVFVFQVRLLNHLI